MKNDLEVFQSISDLLTEQRVAGSNERRGSERHYYPCKQLIAPYDGKHLPQQSDFRLVQCHDISNDGFAFLDIRRPDSQLIVVALGNIPFRFFVAEIVNVCPVSDGSEYRFRAGCRLLRRVGAAKQS